MKKILWALPKHNIVFNNVTRLEELVLKDLLKKHKIQSHEEMVGSSFHVVFVDEVSNELY